VEYADFAVWSKNEVVTLAISGVTGPISKLHKLILWLLFKKIFLVRQFCAQRLLRLQMPYLASPP